MPSDAETKPKAASITESTDSAEAATLPSDEKSSEGEVSAPTIVETRCYGSDGSALPEDEVQLTIDAWKAVYTHGPFESDITWLPEQYTTKNAIGNSLRADIWDIWAQYHRATEVEYKSYLLNALEESLSQEDQGAHLYSPASSGEHSTDVDVRLPATDRWADLRADLRNEFARSGKENKA